MVEMVQRSEDDRALDLWELTGQLDADLTPDADQRMQAFGEWYGIAERKVQAFVASCSGETIDNPEVKEIADEAILLALEAVLKGQFKRKAKFTAYVKKIAYNRLVTRYRRRKKHPEVSLDETVGYQLTVEPLEDGLSIGTKDAAYLINTLPKEQWRQVMRSYFLDGLSYQEISNQIGISTANARKIVERSLKQLVLSHKD